MYYLQLLNCSFLMKHCIVFVLLFLCFGSSKSFGQKVDALNTAFVNKNVFIQIETSTTNCFVGEPVLVSYNFYNSLSGRANIARLPTFNGCSVQEMTTKDNTYSIKEMNGRKFNVSLMRKVQLVPLAAGKIVLDTAAVQDVFTVYNKGTTKEQVKNLSAETHEEKFTIYSKPVFITVNELPTANKPKSFNGAIGDFTISAKLNKPEFSVNEKNAIIISIEGEGNFDNVVCPNIIFPANTEKYDAQVASTVDKMMFPNMGAKEFSIPFIVTKEGNYQFDSIQFAFFNTQSKNYVTVKTGMLKFAVTKNTSAVINKEALTGDITNKKYLWIVPAFAIIAAIGLWLRFRKKQPKQLQLINDAEKRIKEITTPFKPKQEKLDELFVEPNDAVFYKELKLMAEELQKENAESTKILKTVIAECNSYLYAGFTQTDKFTLLQMVKNCC